MPKKKLSREARLRHERRMIRVPVDMGILAQQLLKPKLRYRLRVADDVPFDCLFVTAYYSPEYQDAFFVFAHELFDSVSPNEMLPMKDSKLEKIEDDEDGE